MKARGCDADAAIVAGGLCGGAYRERQPVKIKAKTPTGKVGKLEFGTLHLSDTKPGYRLRRCSAGPTGADPRFPCPRHRENGGLGNGPERPASGRQAAGGPLTIGPHKAKPPWSLGEGHKGDLAGL